MRGLWVCLGTHAAPSAKNRKRFLLVLVVITINGNETTNVRLLNGALCTSDTSDGLDLFQRTFRNLIIFFFNDSRLSRIPLVIN